MKFCYLLFLVVFSVCFQSGHLNRSSSTTQIENGEENLALEAIELDLDRKPEPGKEPSNKPGKPGKKTSRKSGKKHGKKNGRRCWIRDGKRCCKIRGKAKSMKCKPNKTATTTTTPTPTPLDSVYFIAGGYGAMRDISVYHPTVDNVTCSISPPTLTDDWIHHTTFYNNNTIYLCQYMHVYDYYYDDYDYNFSPCISHNKGTEGWKNHTLTPPIGDRHSSIVLLERVYFIGGEDESTSFNYEDYYDYHEMMRFVDTVSTPLPLTDTPVLTTEPNLEYKGMSPCVAKIDEETLVVTGGYYGSKNNFSSSCYLTTVATYNVKTGTYTQLPPLKQGRADHGCGVLERGNTKWIIVAGGKYTDNNILQTTEMLQLGDSEFKPLGNLNVARSGASMTITQRGVMLMGGSVGYKLGEELSSVELLDWNSKTWSVVQPSLNKPRDNFGGAVKIPASMFDCRV